MRYSTSVRTGPWSGSTSAVVTGSGQCMEGVKSMAAPVCSFQRQVRGMARTAPAAAAYRANGRPTRLATSPQITLPRLKDPNMMVTYMASPRPRTHSGSATCAETLRLETPAIQEAPASTLAASAKLALCAMPKSAVARAVATVAPASRTSGPNRERSVRSKNAPATADAPITPSSTP